MDAARPLDPAARHLRRVLVIGATGTVGREVVRALGDSNVEVRALVRAQSTAALPAGVERIAGNTRDADSLARALDGADAVLYVSPHEPDEEALAARFISANADRSRRVVFVGVHVDGHTRLARAAKRAAYGLLFAHYRPKFRISEAVRTELPNSVVLVAPNFFQNDELVMPAIREGRYVLPIGHKGINRVDVRDVAAAAKRALLDADLAPGAYPVSGPVALTGSECAAVWSAELGRAVEYVDDMAVFTSYARAALSGKKLDDMLKSFAFLRKIHMPTEPEQLAATEALLGRRPRSYAEYVRDVCART